MWVRCVSNSLACSMASWQRKEGSAMGYGYGKSSAGDRKKSKLYRVVSEEEKNENAPPEFITVYYLEYIQSGKRLDKKFLVLEDAEKECDEQNNAASPD